MKSKSSIIHHHHQNHHPEGIWETSGRHLGGIWEASGRLGVPMGSPGDPEPCQLIKVVPLSAKMQIQLKNINFTMCF